jgi:hypothetical protein
MLRINYFLLSLAIVGIQLPYPVCAAEMGVPSVFIYSDPFSPSDAYLIDVKKRVITEGDLRFELNICNKDNLFICFTSRSLSFAWPRDGNLKSWNHEQWNYKLINSWLRKSKEREDKIFLIDATREDSEFQFIYSKGCGLIGVYVIGGRSGKYYLLDGKEGFGAEITGSCQK